MRHAVLLCSAKTPAYCASKHAAAQVVEWTAVLELLFNVHHRHLVDLDMQHVRLLTVHNAARHAERALLWFPVPDLNMSLASKRV